MNIWTLLLVLPFILMIVMHLRGGHGGGHGGCCAGHGHNEDDRREDAHAHHSGEAAPDTDAPTSPTEPVGAGPYGRQGGHPHAG